MEPDQNAYTMATIRSEGRSNGGPQHQRQPDPLLPKADVQNMNNPEQGTESAGPMRAQIRESELVTAYRPRPTMGWRRWLYRRTRINLGPSPKERGWNDLE